VGARHAGVDVRFPRSEACALQCARLDHALADCGAGFAGFLGTQFFKRDGGRFDVEVNAVEQRTRNALAVAFDLDLRAAAGAFRIAVVAARAWLRF
jgi:hypothetical protein